MLNLPRLGNFYTVGNHFGDRDIGPGIVDRRHGHMASWQDDREGDNIASIQSRPCLTKQHQQMATNI